MNFGHCCVQFSAKGEAALLPRENWPQLWAEDPAASIMESDITGRNMDTNCSLKVIFLAVIPFFSHKRTYCCPAAGLLACYSHTSPPHPISPGITTPRRCAQIHSNGSVHNPEQHLHAADGNRAIISGKAPEKHNLPRESARFREGIDLTCTSVKTDSQSLQPSQADDLEV